MISKKHYNKDDKNKNNDNNNRNNNSGDSLYFEEYIWRRAPSKMANVEICVLYCRVFV